tara:strand:+ start:8461 stop:8985 length:525 start_codon:yes stop_codon:yes gene_type:complete
MNVNDIYVSACRGAFDKNVQDVRLIDWLENVRPEQPRNDWEKKQLPAIMPHGLFMNRKQNTFQAASGLIQIDIDAKHQDKELNINEILHHVAYSNCIVVAGKSCSGTGLYMLIAVNGITVDNFTDCADKAILYVEKAYDIKCDSPVSMNLSSLRFASPYAPYINYDVEPLTLEV